MRRGFHVLFWLTLASVQPAAAQRTETVPFGDFEHWTVRHIKESAILGGETKTLYVVGPDAVIDGNRAYDYSNTIWASSNAYARVSGITKTSVTVVPEDGPDGKCAKLSTGFASCRVAGLVEISVLASGSLYWGSMLEPVTGVRNPYGFMDWGIPFTRRPQALVLDYRSELPATGMLTKGTTFSHQKFPGEDPCLVTLLLQHRWEDGQGNVHAKRVGTAAYLISSTSKGWVKGFRIPVIYGDARKSPSYNSGMALYEGRLTLYTVNSKGKRVPIIEEWGDADTPVTHAILSITAGSKGAFIGEPGNTLWVDNVRLEYP